MDCTLSYFSSSLIVSTIVMIGIYFVPKESEAKRFDLAWALGLIGITLFTFIYNGNFMAKQILLTTLTLISSLRLGLFLYFRPDDKDDKRYATLKKKLGGNGLVLFLLQAVIVLLISFPQIYVNSDVDGTIGIISIIGTFLWLIGFCFESFADYQLKMFLNNPANKGKVLDTGLWKYSRHPNYFGQLLISWGLWFFASLHFKALISPIITYLLIKKFSGIPVVEKKMLTTVPGYADYVKKTNVLVPWFSDDYWDDK